eukprot:scaffold5260_cov242-Pinguiococcus_pyrenoidosus.AAC.2
MSYFPLATFANPSLRMFGLSNLGPSFESCLDAHWGQGHGAAKEESRTQDGQQRRQEAAVHAEEAQCHDHSGDRGSEHVQGGFHGDSLRESQGSGLHRSQHLCSCWTVGDQAAARSAPEHHQPARRRELAGARVLRASPLSGWSRDWAARLTRESLPLFLADRTELLSPVSGADEPVFRHADAGGAGAGRRRCR